MVIVVKMDLISLLLQIYILSSDITYLNSYVLFAANVEDFQRIARKLGSENFIEQLHEIAHNPTFESYTQKRKERVNGINHKRERDKKPIGRQSEPKMSLSLKDSGTKIDFEELVERVKQRLETEFRNKYKNVNVHTTKDINTHRNKLISKTYMKMRPTKRFINKIQFKRTTKTTTRDNYDYEEAIQNNSHERIEVELQTKDKQVPMYADAMIYEETKPKINVKYEIQNNTKIYYDNIYDYETEHTKDVSFKKVDMMKHDSYEDYITPAKEKNIFVSSEKTTSRNRYKIKNNRLKMTTDYETTPKTTDIEYDVTIGSAEIKARTEKLWYDENDYNDTKIISDERYKGTGVPTRETYKIMTPNYYASLPTMAERYDFNEPLPERDRERENIKYIGNPPARINRKIRLLK